MEQFDMHDDPRVRSYIDTAIFVEVQDLDDADHAFSRDMVKDFYEQFQDSVAVMEDGLRAADLPLLSAKGHFLKGSAAALGLWRIQDCCEKIQHLGSQMDETGTKHVPDRRVCLDRIAELLVAVKQIFDETKNAFKYIGY